jgi:hypothetical protein
MLAATVVKATEHYGQAIKCETIDSRHVRSRVRPLHAVSLAAEDVAPIAVSERRYQVTRSHNAVNLPEASCAKRKDRCAVQQHLVHLRIV